MARQGVYVCDYETTTDPNDCRVWAWGSYEIFKDAFKWGTDLTDFFAFIKSLNDKDKIYFHNLKFDGEFIFYHLFKELGFEHVTTRTLEEKQFTTVISDMGQFYSISFMIDGKRINIYDSLKLLPFKVSQLSKAFGIEQLKGEIDYHKLRPIGYKALLHEVEYIKNDCEIVGKALFFFLDKGLTKMTIASNALSSFKKTIGGNKNFRHFFPELQQDSELRQSYKGGFTYVNEMYQGKEIKEGLVFDINSEYPYVMYSKMLPYGEPLLYQGNYEHDKFYPLYIQTFRCNFEVKKDHIPMLQLKQNPRFIATEYLKSSNGHDVTLCMTSVDIELFFKHYNVYNIEWFYGWKFKQSNEFFKEYIDYWMGVKEEATKTGNEGLRTLAKLMLNSLYGKFGLNPIVKSKYPSYDEGIDFIKYIYSQEKERPAIYIPMASFITAYAREMTINTAQKYYDRFIYADTDSIHLTGYDIPDDLDIHSSKLGAWDLEVKFDKGRYLRAKTYMEHIVWEKGKWLETPFNKITVAGMPDSCKDSVSFDNFFTGLKVDGKLQAKRVTGGVVLLDTDFTIKI